MNVCLFTCCIACDARGKTRTKGASLQQEKEDDDEDTVLMSSQTNYHTFQ